MVERGGDGKMRRGEEMEKVEKVEDEKEKEEMEGDEREIREGVDLVTTTPGYLCIHSCVFRCFVLFPFILLHSTFTIK